MIWWYYTSERAPPNTSQTGWYSINLPRRDGRLSWPRFLGTQRDGLTASRQSPIQVVTVPSVEQLHWSRPTCYQIQYLVLLIHRSNTCTIATATFSLLSHEYKRIILSGWSMCYAFAIEYIFRFYELLGKNDGNIKIIRPTAHSKTARRR